MERRLVENILQPLGLRRQQLSTAVRNVAPLKL
jgi:hypothetical protein